MKHQSTGSIATALFILLATVREDPYPHVHDTAPSLPLLQWAESTRDTPKLLQPFPGSGVLQPDATAWNRKRSR